VWADAGYHGKPVAEATSLSVEIVTGPPSQKVLSCRSVPGWWSAIAWIGRNRRLAKDYERQASTAVAFVFLAGAAVLLKRVKAAA
jgi:hypothetical protein